MSGVTQQERLQVLGLRTKSILLVVENIHTRKHLTELCRTLDLRQISLAMTPSDAVTMLQEAQFDFVICNWSQPPLDNPRFVACVRASDDPKIKQVPIIVLNSQARQTDVIEARDAGMTEFLIPPLSAQSLLQKFESILLKPRTFIDDAAFRGPDRRRPRGRSSEQHRRRADASEQPTES